MKEGDFVHLHTHTEYSLLDGMIRISDLVRTVVSYNMPAIAITDHGNIFGAVEFFKQAESAGIKPIIGCELYMARQTRHSRDRSEGSPYHLVVLCENEQGYKNLCQLITASYLEGFYYKPRVDRELLEKYGKGLIALSSCLQGEIPQLLLAGKEKEAEKRLEWYQAVFGKDGFYLELQHNGLDEQAIVNQRLIQLAERTGAPLVCTNDCHYLKPDGARLQEILICIQQNKKIDDPNRFQIKTDQLYLRSPQEMKHLFRDVPSAIKNTIAIAERCQFYFDFEHIHLPTIELKEGEKIEEKFEKQAKEGFEKRLAELKELYGDALREDEYRKRFEYELEIIKNTGFAGYFLIVADFIGYARKKGIPVGPGRGSAAGSLVAYALGITNVDPIRYGLLFERFLNPERKEMPDIDVDFCKERRDEVIKYVTKKYGGETKVVQLITFAKLKTKAVVRDVARILNIPTRLIDQLSKLVPDDAETSLLALAENDPRLKELVESEPRLKEVFSIANEIRGLNRHPGVHAAGVVISDRPIIEYMPLHKSTREHKNVITTQFDGDSVAQLGLVKFDLLGLRNLTVIDQTIKLIKERRGTEINIDRIPLDDPKTFELISRGETAGIFQMESKGMAQLAMKIQPRKIDELIDLIALYRPGPLQSGVVDEYIARKQGKKPIEYPLPELEEILRDTYGVIVYQEQVMRIAQKIAGYTAGQADRFRKAMGKKEPEIMEAERENFVNGCVKMGYNKSQAEELFEVIKNFAGYAFNKSHSTAYAIIAYQTAYLKAHYPLEYMTMLLSSEMGNADKLIAYLEECKRMGLEVIPPHINTSFWNFSIKDEKILYGLGAVKNVGKKAVDAIVAEREKNGAFSSLFDFCERIDLHRVNRRVIESLIKAGAFDGLGAKRSQMMAVLEQVLEQSQSIKQSRSHGQVDIFQLLEDKGSKKPSKQYPALEEWDMEELLNYEKEVLGHYISGHPMVRYQNLVASLHLPKLKQILNMTTEQSVVVCGFITHYQEKKTRNKEQMANFKLEDLTGRVDVVVFPSILAESREVLKTQDQPVIVQGRIRIDESHQIIAEKLFTIDQALEQMVNSIHLWINAEIYEEKDLEKLKNLLMKKPGKCKVVLHLEFKDKAEVVLALPEKYSIQPSQQLVQEYEQMFNLGNSRLEMMIK